jgi:diguanylate cyclase (GGDEF)-like protein
VTESPDLTAPGFARQWLRRSFLGAGTAAAMALVLVLAAALGVIDAEVAAEGCIALAVLVAAFYAILRSGRNWRYADPSLATAQLASAFVLLGYLTYRTGGAPSLLAALYLIAMLYGVLRLPRQRLMVLAIVALVLHGVALFMLIDRGRKIDLASAWTQFGALAVGLFWFAYAAGAVSRLRGRLSDTRRGMRALATEAREHASRDALTGAYHRRALIEAFEREAARSDRSGKPLSIARIDVDRFRTVNEAHGLAAGDAVLKRFAAVAQRAIRDVDVLGRYGGKEFIVVMPDTSLAGALIAAERIRSAVDRESFRDLAGERRITCTSGLAQYRKGENLAHTVGRAEASLNYGKAAGRNRVIALNEQGRPLAA